MVIFGPLVHTAHVSAQQAFELDFRPLTTTTSELRPSVQLVNKCFVIVYNVRPDFRTKR